MRNYIGYIIDYSDGTLSDRKRKWFESELVQNDALRNEFNLFKQVNSYMRGKSDLDEIRKSSELKEVDILTKQMVSTFQSDPEKFESARTFIENSTIQNQIYLEIQKELNLTSDEIKKHNLNDITKGWVDEWNSTNQKENVEAVNRRAFINSALSDNVNQDKAPTNRNNRNNRNIAIRIIGFAAAALIAALIVVKTLVPSSDPEDIYRDFYKPLKAYTSTTRNSANIVDPFANAVEKYKQGQFQIAGVMFTDLIYEDPSNFSYRFFSGLSQMELSNFEQSIKLFSEVISNNGEFQKEAKWYLSLSYIKTHNLQKASVLLTELSQEKGYYQTLAQDLLERMK